jgi:hypothetical protein
MDTNQNRREQKIMEIKCKMIKELPDGSAIMTVDLDEDARDFLIGEGFLVVVKRALESSESYVSPDKQVKLGLKPKAKAKKK